uniref:Uncharacterized protein n=1 Tax=Physcomitrium patens TaxID=3218 RepID=A0A2K1JK59_PHYPA|nr:hypothetical protein PHYPA_016793 [Physcomitrium patens]
MELILTPSTMILMEGEPVVQQVESGQRHRDKKLEGLSGPGLGDTAVSGVVSKAALTDASGIGTLVACGSLVEVKDGADIDFVKDDPDGRRAGGTAGGERAKT